MNTIFDNEAAHLIISNNPLNDVFQQSLFRPLWYQLHEAIKLWLLIVRGRFIFTNFGDGENVWVWFDTNLMAFGNINLSMGAPVPANEN